MLKLDLPYYCCHVRRCRSICVSVELCCVEFTSVYIVLCFIFLYCFFYIVCVCQWRRSQVKSGGWIKLRRVKGWVWEGAVPSSVGGSRGFPPEKNQFCAKKLCNSEQVLVLRYLLYYSIIRTYQRIRESGGLSPQS